LIENEDCVEVYGSGGSAYIMRFFSENGEIVEIKDSYNVDVIYFDSNSNIVETRLYGYHRTEENSRQYISILYDIIQK